MYISIFFNFFNNINLSFMFLLANNHWPLKNTIALAHLYTVIIVILLMLSKIDVKKFTDNNNEQLSKDLEN